MCEPDWEAPFGDLADAVTGKELRAATEEELEASRNSPDGEIIIDGRRCFVYEPGS